MPAIGNIALSDAEVSPVTHTFAPVTTNGSAAKLANRAASIPKGFETLELEMVAPQSANAAHRLKFKMSFPTVETVDGQDVVVRTSTLDGVVNFSQLSTAQDRKNYAKLLSGLFANATVVTMVENLEPLY